MPIADLIPEPVSRTLRIYSFDPSVAAAFETHYIGEITIPIPWEKELKPGPVGEYLEVVDADPASGFFYKPIDLNDKRVLALDGLDPSESNPQFHQQMVYAVAMNTIAHFEEALGRVALWSDHWEEGQRDATYVGQLRIYPHALRDRNAYYSPVRKALLFGYFQVGLKDKYNAPGTVVFTCLSHDIVAHETTHALLDGVHPRFNEQVNPDVLAFHEAFSDIVALFQHFSYPGVLRDQIARTRGELMSDNLLGQLAQQFGRATGRSTALRDALGGINPQTKKWEAHTPDVHKLARTFEPHDRGAILVAAIFSAFLKVYRSRTRDLYRIATEGTGVLREGDIHPDLSARLANEASKCARTVLRMCIRAIDYCPPVGITFGDYLRGIVTADLDYCPEDDSGFRLAFVDAFREWGIYPENMNSISVESLRWPDGEGLSVKSLFEGRHGRETFKPWNLQSKRSDIWKEMDKNRITFWYWLMSEEGRKVARKHLGIVLDEDKPPATVYRSRNSKEIAVEVHSVRTALRRTLRGETMSDLVVEITQRRRGYFDPAVQKRCDKEGARPNEKSDFTYRAGCTLLISPSTMEIRHVIRTPGTVADDKQLDRMRRFLTGDGVDPGNAFDSAMKTLRTREPFALLHRDGED